MFDLILTDDPTNWPWSAYINLPLIPLSLISSRFPSSSSFAIPLLLVWPPFQPVGEPARKLFEYWSRPENARHLNIVPRSNTLWPPPPLLFGLFGVPIIKALYRRAYARIYKRVMGTPPPRPQRRRPTQMTVKKRR